MKKVVERLSTPAGLLGLYGLFLAMVAFWPVPVDRPVSALVQALGKLLPVFTYQRVEFLANIALFAPLGVLLALWTPKSLRYLVMPIGFVVSVLVEGFQALLLPARTPSLYDILANTAGACLGLILIVVADYRSESASASGQAGTNPHP